MKRMHYPLDIAESMSANSCLASNCLDSLKTFFPSVFIQLAVCLIRFQVISWQLKLFQLGCGFFLVGEIPGWKKNPKDNYLLVTLCHAIIY